MNWVANRMMAKIREMKIEGKRVECYEYGGKEYQLEMIKDMVR